MLEQISIVKTKELIEYTSDNIEVKYSVERAQWIDREWEKYYIQKTLVSNSFYSSIKTDN